MASIISEPNTTVNIIPAQQTVNDNPQKVLFIGQMKTGTATPLALVSNIGVQGEEDGLFGANSMLAGMVREARKLNQITQFDAIALADDAGGTAATGSVEFSGTASAAGSFTMTIGSQINYAFTLAITNGQTAAQIATAFVALINANTDLPFTASVTTSTTVTLTCDHKGTVGNQFGLALSGSATGITPTLTGISGGATDPSLTTVFNAITDLRYQTVAWPNTYSKSTVVNFLDGRFNTENGVLDGVAITSNTDTLANLLTALSGLNSKSLFFNCNSKINISTQVGPSLFEIDDMIASQVAALRSLRLTDGADIGDIVLGANGALDSIGGMALASLPYANTPFANLPLVQAGYGFLKTEIDQLNAAGGSVIGNNTAANTTIMGKAYTTYKTDSAGDPDVSFSFLNYVDTASVCREYFNNNLRDRFAQSRLTSGDLVNGRIITNAQGISTFIDGLYNDLAALALTQRGPDALRYFKSNKTITLDMEKGSATVYMKVPIVVQLRTIIVTMQLSFTNLGG